MCFPTYTQIQEQRTEALLALGAGEQALLNHWLTTKHRNR